LIKAYCVDHILLPSRLYQQLTGKSMPDESAKALELQTAALRKVAECICYSLLFAVGFENEDVPISFCGRQL
jgi:hypothetical protein